MHFVYIIYSKKSDKYYVGETTDVEQRIHWHNSHYFKRASTVIADDWELCLSINCKNIQQARKIEKYIKQMKSRVFIEKLVKENNTWLLEKFK